MNTAPGVRSLAQPIAALFASLFVVALATTFVLPNRPAPAVIKAFFDALAGAVKATLGAASGTSSSLTGGNVPSPTNIPPGMVVVSGHIVPSGTGGVVSGTTGHLVQTSQGGYVQ